MNIGWHLEFDESRLEQLALLTDVDRIQIQAAMAYRFAEMVFDNFGEAGDHRPATWKMLSKKYADQFHGGSRIPTEILTGDLRDSIGRNIDISNPEYSTVTTDIEYAYDQQFGDPSINLPARPFFPMIEPEGGNDVFTPYALEEVVAAAEMELDRVLTENH